MIWPKGERLYNSLPVVIRTRDVEQGEPLRALLAAVESEFEKLEDNIDGLYENWFIETCEEWVIPYIADLLRVRPIHPIGSAGVYSLRAYVANTIAYRRRKGTAAVLEQLARDISGWPARVVEYFELLSTTQYMNHLRPDNLCTLDLRHRNKLELLNSPFDTAAHTLEVRRIASNRGKYNIRNIGLHLWRLQAYPIKMGTAYAFDDSPAPAWRFTFSPLGKDAPLFNQPQAETEITHLAEEINVPGRLRRFPLYQELEEQRLGNGDAVYFGEDPVIRVFSDDEIASAEITICNLEQWARPSDASITVAVDPVLGRLAFRLGAEPVSGAVEVSYSYGFSGDVGGGPYNHQPAMPEAENAEEIWQAFVTAGPIDSPPAQVFATVSAALTAWNTWSAQSDNRIGVIAIMDNRSYIETLDIDVPKDRQLMITSGALPEMTVLGGLDDIVRDSGKLVRPHIKGNLTVTGGSGTDDSICKLVLDGLLIEGGLTVAEGNLTTLQVTHCTLVPDPDPDVGSLVVADSLIRCPSISLERTICGSIILPASPDNAQVPDLSIVDCIIDGRIGPEIHSSSTDEGNQAWVETAGNIQTSTILGTTKLHSLEASESIFDGIVQVKRRQIGCIRFCYLLHKLIDGSEYYSQTPRRFRCQPALALTGEKNEAIKERIRRQLQPTYTSKEYSVPEYAQLSLTCPLEIRTGAEDGSEMGVFNHLKQPQREANLKEALDEYLRYGLEAGIFYLMEESQK